MAIFKCKMCGGNLTANEKMTVGTCESCGSTMTLPGDTGEKKANLFNRANHYRRSNDFDKAMATYENILNEDDADAEAHWGLVLCKYGIEYVEDPKTGKRVPTCHRAQYGSVLADADYRAAVANAEGEAKALYEGEARQIEGIQKQILEISAKEEPFDVFICYKETSDTGSRTKDSVIAQDIYYHLKDAGLKVFFSRVTLEDKLGTAYEPYIFAALNSSKVMVVVGTGVENFNATWTKNEWSRYLSLMKQGAKKALIPAYRDMDAYELPEEFAHLQAQDMGRIGFIQDLTVGIKKLLVDSTSKDARPDAPIVGAQAQTTAKPLLDRAFLCLEDGDFAKADELLEQVLNLDPRNPNAYVGKLMVEMKAKQEYELANGSVELEQNSNYKKAIRFADEGNRKMLEGYNRANMDRLEEERKWGFIQLGDGVEMEFVRVPAGEFQMGSNDGKEDEKPVHTVYLDEYWIGRYPVTNEQYGCYVKGQGVEVPKHWQGGKPPTGEERHPVDYVNWKDCRGFCDWLNGKVQVVMGKGSVRLPSEAEWEKAARGTDGRTYPWGNQEPDKSLLNYDQNEGGTTPVGKYPKGASPYGALDMAGNVWEWVNDWYDETYYSSQFEWRNPTGPTTGQYRIFRGGSWYNTYQFARSALRLRNDPVDWLSNCGFRCACSQLS